MEPQTAEKTFFITFKSIMNVVCQELNITPDEVIQPSRTPGAKRGRRVFARQLCIAISKRYCLGDEEQIGQFYNRDRASVYASVKSINNDIETNEYRRNVYNAIISKLTKHGRVGLPEADMKESIKTEVSNFEYQDISEEALSFQCPVR